MGRAGVETLRCPAAAARMGALTAEVPMRIAPKLLLLAPLLLATACKEGGPTASAPGQPSGGVAGAARFGAALSITGAAAVYGAQQRAGIEAAVEEINASGSLPVKIEVLIEDDASSKEQGINVFQRF